MNNNVIKVLISVFALVTVLLGFMHGRAHADPKTGMFWVTAASADGVRVRKLEDTTSGVICYVAIDAFAVDNGNTSLRSPAISCVKANP